MPQFSAFALRARLARPVKPLLQIMPWSIGALCLWVLSQQIGPEARGAIPATLRDISAMQWVGAGLATMLSFVALARYDIALHRHLRTGLDDARAGRVGAASIALSQTLGMGVLTGALVRWRMIDGLSPGAAMRLSLGVAVSFLLALALLTSVVTIVLPVGILPRGVSIAIALASITAVFLSFLRPVWGWRGWALRMPSLPVLAAIFGWALLDMLAACAALYMLLPDTASLPFGALFPAFLLALGAGLITGSPGGVGPFELTLVALLPTLPEAPLMAGVLGFRLIYYALPAMLALLYMIGTARNAASGPVTRPFQTLTSRDLPPCRRHAEQALCLHNGARRLDAGATSWPILETSQSTTVLIAPLRGLALAGLGGLRRHARARASVLCLYKCDGRLAAKLRRTGLRALHVADEAVLDPQGFTLARPSCRGLRRKLKQAAKSGVTVHELTAPDFVTLARIDAAWQREHGPARGISMGRFCPDLLSSQRVFVATREGRTLAFVSWHHCQGEWTLDLMRMEPQAPNGTMHALVMAALEAARLEGVMRLSLAGLPRTGAGDPIGRLVQRMTANPGLTRFKTAFCPRREPRYALSTSWPALLLALLDLALAVRRPDRHRTHHDHEEYEFALAPQA